MKALVFIVALLLPSLVFAQAITAVDVTTLTDGDYVLTKKAGVVSVRPLTLVVPGNLPGPTPPPTPPNTRSEIFKTSALAIGGDTGERSTNAKALALLYRELSKNVKAGQILDPLTLKAVVGMGTDLLLKKPSATSTIWQPFRDTLGTQWTLLDSKSSPVSAYADLLDDAATGLEGSTPLKAISPEMIALIMQIIQLIMKLFFPM